MRIKLFTPSAHQVYKNIKRDSKRQPMLGPSYLVAALLADGHEVGYLDGDAMDLFSEKAADEILKDDPHLVGISFTTPMFSEAKDVARRLKESGWTGHLTLGGVHSTAVPEETLRLIPWADSVVVGEGENTLCELAKALKDNNVDGPIKGCVIRGREDDVATIGKTRLFAENLDEIPLPALDHYPMDRYVSPMWSSEENKKMGVLITSRGCAFNCEFCASGKGSWGMLRFHSVERVLVEVKRLKEKYKVDYLVFNDDTFTVNKKRCIEICLRMKDESINLPFMVTARVDTVTPEFLEVLKSSGCFLMTYGIESGSDDVLKSIGKGISLEKARLAVEWTKEAGIKTIGNYIFGHWHDTSETCKQTLDFSLELECDMSQFAICIPYPGTTIHKRAISEGRIFPTDDYCNFGYYGNMPWKHPNLSESELVGYQRRAYELNNK